MRIDFDARIAYLTTLRDQLAEATAVLTAGQLELGEKTEQKRVMKTSTDCAPKLIDDCDVTAWTPEVCSVECEDGGPVA